jgi:predicted esterase
VRQLLASALAAALALVAACGSDAPPTTVNFALPGTAGADYFDLPFPGELHRAADGSVDLSGVPRPSELVGEYLDEFARSGYGFGTQSAIYFRLSGPVDPASLPDPNGTLAAGAAVFLVDVDPASPDHGTRVPLKLAFRPLAGQFIGPNSLVLLPYPGFVLRGATTYAAVITTAVRDAGGAPVAPAPALQAILGGGGDATARAALQPLLDWLDAGGDAPARTAVAGATVFRTQDATATMARLRDVVYDSVAAPTAAGVTHYRSQSFVEVFTGTYDAPNFQQGTPPYRVPAQGGTFQLDASGAPVPVRTETMRFAVTVPRGTMPADGWPVVLYAHGTGGNYLSLVSEGVGDNLGRVTDADGNVVGAMATFGIDQVLHGPRDPTGSNPELTFFNFQNIAGARDNVRQGAADNFQLLRLAERLQVTMPDGSTARFDASRVAFMGHSQGGLTGPGFVATEPRVRAAVLSGAGANLLLSLLGKTEPVDIPALVAGLLGEEVDEFHPFLNLVQMYFEPGDPGNYARGFFREPGAAQPAKNVFLSLGLVDHYTPLPTIMALAVAMGVQPVTPVLEPVAGMDLLGLAPATAPVTGNVAGGAATGVVCEYQAAAGDDGHFVLFDVPAARAAYARFLATAMGDDVATLLP